jgi:hypothetical protein
VRRICYAIAAVLVLSGLFHLAVYAVLGGPWEGPVSWRKPTTFGLSFGATLATVTWLSTYLRLPARLSALLLGVFALDSIAEVGLITLQAWRKVPSHFNFETPFDRSVTMVLAIGGGVLIAVLVVFAVAALRGNPDVSPGMRLALRAGFVTLLIGLASGAAMIARGVVLVNTGHQELAYQLGGFLKLVHGISLHGVLVLPAIAWLLDRLQWTDARRTRTVALASAAYGVAILVALVISLARARF